MLTGFWWGNLKERDRMETLGVDGWQVSSVVIVTALQSAPSRAKKFFSSPVLRPALGPTWPPV
jgi:hypothetical protein